MLKNILKINGAQELTRSQQRAISGGGLLNECSTDADCRIHGPCFECISDPISGENFCFWFFNNPNPACQQ